jgi:EAL domain-containing protein (putative c-di-GMP-specific phosphodiesterase class I)
VLHDPEYAVLRALQELAARWQASVVAEGVETPEQLAAIRSIGITAGQGYLLGRPSRDRRVRPIDIESLLPRPIEAVEGSEAEGETAAA